MVSTIDAAVVASSVSDAMCLCWVRAWFPPCLPRTGGAPRAASLNSRVSGMVVQLRTLLLSTLPPTPWLSSPLAEAGQAIQSCGEPRASVTACSGGGRGGVV
jgi:hypothetical protein